MSDTTIPEEDAPNCAVCSNKILDYATHRVIGNANDWKVEYKHFCDAGCESSYHT